MVKLYIENQFIELDNEVQFAITKTFEDITNPTSIINDWSKTVSIPFTDNNNEVFGHIYNPDRLTLHTSNESLTTGLYFDPLKKLDFRLEWDSMLLMQGYAKMTSVTKSDGKGRYNVTLNGELGKIFQEMKKITFDETNYTGEDKDKYWIDGSKYGSQIINAATLKEMWTEEHIYNEELNDSTLINFAPNNAMSDGFDYTSFQKGNDSIVKFTDVLNEIEFTEEAGVEPDNVIPNGILPREIGEYRSYLQLPYIHFYKLFLIFKEQFENITDYKINLNKEWFNKYNPYWTNLAFMLEMLNISTKNQIHNTYDMRLFPITTGYGWEFGTSTSTPTSNPNSVHTFDILPMQQFSPEEKQPIVNWNVTSKRPFKTTLILSTNKVYKLTLQTPALYIDGKQETFKLNPANALEISVKNNYIAVNPDNSYTNINSYSQKYLICGTDYTGSKSGYYRVIKVGNAENSASWSKFNFELPLEINLSKITGDNIYSYISFDAKWVKNIEMLYAIGEKEVSSKRTTLTASDQMFEININEKVKRSGASFTINDVWNNEYNLFNEIINYCKIFRILINTDEIKKEITFTPSTSFFNNYNILDWTNKLDISKEYSIKPITFENKYVVFNYDDSESNLNNAYKKKYGVNFGEYKLTTDYNFNNEEKNLFDKIKSGIAYTPYILSWNNLYNNKLVTYSLPNEVYISSSDKDNKQIKLFGSYLFYNGLKAFDTEESLNLRPVSISDDTDYQVAYKTFCYTQGADTIYRVDTYPQLSNIYDVYFSTFGTPIQNYTSLEIPQNSNDIYTTFWQNYLDERYNTNNKIVTCYLDITPIDYCNFEFNKFIKIDNQLYFVNKIYDYDVASNSTTKVDLITVQDIAGYTDNNFVLNFFEVFFTPTEIYKPDFHYISLDEDITSRTIYISSSSDVTWEITNIEEGTIKNFTINGVSGNKGVIKKGVLQPVKFSTFNTNARFIVTFNNEQGATFDVSVVSSVQTMPIYTEDNKLVKDLETLTLAGQNEPSITVYVTSDTNVDVKIHNYSGSLSDVQINGAYASEVYPGYDTVTLEAGVKVPLTISTIYGGDDFNLEMYLNNGSVQRVFYVDCVW